MGGSQEHRGLRDIPEIGTTGLLSRADWEALTRQAGSWYGTPGHCLLYARNPPGWVALWRDAQGLPTAACHGNSRRWLGFGRHAALVGPSSASLEMLGRLMARLGAWVLTMPYLDAADERWRGLRWWEGSLREFESDWVVDLPSSVTGYLAGLGGTTRRHVTAYARKLHERLDTLPVVAEGRDIDPQLVAELVELHRKRREDAGLGFHLTPDMVERRTRLAHECGLFCGRLAGGRLIGGTLNYLHGQTAYLSLVAHDPSHNDLHCGLVCLLDTIQLLIERGVGTYNLHVRHSPFKTRMGGKEHPLREAVVFANPAVAALWHVGRWIRRFRRGGRAARLTPRPESPKGVSSTARDAGWRP